MTTRELPENDWRRAVYGRSTVSGIGSRRRPNMTDRLRVQRVQGNRCLYCEIPTGATIFRNGKSVILRTNWDHFIPYAYLARNPNTNWVLACHVCNGIKSCRMFDTVQDARNVILPAREAKGYEDPREALLRLGLTPQGNPWPDKIRTHKGRIYHRARLIRDGVHATACGREFREERLFDGEIAEPECRMCAVRCGGPLTPFALPA